MSDLIARLEALTGPDREVDEAIACLIAQPHPKHGKPIGMLYCARYTSLIDSALVLLPPGWEAHTLAFPQGAGRSYGFEIYPPSGHAAWKNGSVIGRGANAAIAICVAALMARQAAEVQNV